jgi:predicted Zn-dependent protease
MRAVALNPGSANVWFNSGYVLLIAGQNENAIEHLNNAMRFDTSGPNRPAHLFFLAFAHFFEKRFTEALTLVRERIQYSESPGGYALLAATYAYLGQLSPAQEALARYRSLSPLPIETLVQVFLDSAQRKLIVEGVALADGEIPSDTSSSD